LLYIHQEKRFSVPEEFMLQEVHEISVSTQEILLYAAGKRFVMLQVRMKSSGTELPICQEIYQFTNLYR
jgi:hypothetical protein